MTTCARRQEPDLMGDDQGQPASKQDPAAGWLAGHGLSGRARQSSHMSQGLLVASAGFQRPGSFFVHTLPATRARRQHTNCTAHFFLASLLPLTLHICIQSLIPTHIFASNPRQPISPVSLFLSHSRPAAASGRLHHFHFLPSEPVPIRASARHTNPPPRIHLTATHNTLPQLSCSLYVTA